MSTLLATADAIRNALAERANPDKAAPMRAYMKSEMPFLGVQRAARREVERAVRAAARALPGHAWRELVDTLWREASFREHRYVALWLLELRHRELVEDDLAWLRALIVDGSWWDYTDDVVGKSLSPWLARNRAAMVHMDAWIEDDELWVRRAALISQLKHKRDTDAERLFAYIRRTAHEKEFFIRKAIGWVLREYARTAPQDVRSFVLEHEAQLSGLSVREALKHIGRTP